MRVLLLSVAFIALALLGKFGGLRAEEEGNEEESYATTEAPALEPPAPVFIENLIAIKVEQIGGGISLIFGTIGNILSILVLMRPKLRYNNVSLYLMVLAISDMTMLVFGQGGRHWIRSLTGYDPPKDSEFYCQFWQIIAVASVYSNYVLAGVSFERCLAVLFPLKARRFLSRKSAKIYLIVSMICIILYRIHAFWTFKVSIKKGEKKCGIDASNYFAKEIRPWYDLVLKWGVPMVIIVISNIFIIRSLYKAKTKREELDAGAEAANKEGKDDKDKKLQSLVTMLIVVSITFIIMVSPVHLNYVVSATFDTSYSAKERGSAIQRLTFACGITAVYLNHAINFFLYVISGGDFREELKLMLLGWMPCIKSSSPTKTMERSGSYKSTMKTVSQSA